MLAIEQREIVCQIADHLARWDSTSRTHISYKLSYRSDDLGSPIELNVTFVREGEFVSFLDIPLRYYTSKDIPEPTECLQFLHDELQQLEERFLPA